MPNVTPRHWPTSVLQQTKRGDNARADFASRSTPIKWPIWMHIITKCHDARALITTRYVVVARQEFHDPAACLILWVKQSEPKWDKELPSLPPTLARAHCRLWAFRWSVMPWNMIWTELSSLPSTLDFGKLFIFLPFWLHAILLHHGGCKDEISQSFPPAWLRCLCRASFQGILRENG